MLSKLNISTYSLRNRGLRFFKRYRHWYRSTISNFFELILYFIILIVATILIILWYVLFFNTNSKPTANYKAGNFSWKSNHNKLNSTKWNNIILQYETNESRLGLIENQIDLKKKNDGYQAFAFNALVSERLGFFRETLPDTRNELCKKAVVTFEEKHIAKSDDLSTSVIICFYNEEFYTLIRTCNSILKRTPKHLLLEILLIDDCSDNDLKTKLDKYLNESNDQHFNAKVRYLRMPERSGLIRSRNYGAIHSRGKILFFLDSHVEVNLDWLPPILERLQMNAKIVACPIIDLIDPDTFHYKPSPMVRGGFNWALHFKWDSIPSEDLASPRDFIKPISSPAMAGGLFAIHREYFFQLGAYDSGMNIWGAENIEFSLRIWMCGGQLEIIPCSRVGHIFRKRRPYDSPDGQDTLAYNSLRVAMVWLDDYKKHFLQTRSDLATMSFGNIEERLKLKKDLKCHSFEWYLKNIYPELLQSLHKPENQTKKKFNLFPHKSPKIVEKYQINLNGTNLCLESKSELSYKNLPLYLRHCSALSSSRRRQIWKQTEQQELRMGTKGCLDSVQGKKLIRLGKCHEMGGTQKWSLQYYHNPKSSNHPDNHSKNFKIAKLYNVGTGTCLVVKSPFKIDQIGNFSENNLLNNDVDNYALTEPYKLFMSFCDHHQTHDDDYDDSNIFVYWNLISIQN